MSFFRTRTPLLSIAVLFFMMAIPGNAQVVSSLSVQKAIDEKNTVLASQLNNQYVNYYTKAKNTDSLITAMLYAGTIAIELQDNQEGTKKMKALLTVIKNISSSRPQTMRAAYVEAADYYNSSGQYQLAYEANKQAHDYGLKIPGLSYSQLAISQNNMSTNIQRVGNRIQAQVHTQQALRYLSMDPKPDFEVMYNSYNGLGILMWYASKLDSAAFFYKKALEALQKASPTATNKFYRPAIIYNNLSSIYSVQGKPGECIKALQACIASYREFIGSKDAGAKKMSAMTFQLEATDNLGSVYNELGNYRQAHDLLYYSYQQKQKILSADNPGLYISEILLGRIYFSLKDFDKAAAFLHKGLQRIYNTEGSQPVWEADAYHTLAMISAEKKDVTGATRYYEKTDSLFNQYQQGDYDNIYLDFLRSASQFYAKKKMITQALNKANKGYDYIRRTEGASSLLFFQQVLNVSEVYFEAGNYSLSLDYSNKAIQLVTTIAAQSSTLADSIMVEMKKPKAILLHTKSLYHLKEKSQVFLTSLLSELNEALAILERRKTLLRDEKDISLMMADHTELLEFTKTIMLDLYGTGNNKNILFDLLSLHESSIYNRLRTRLDKADVAIASLPESVRNKEATLKNKMTDALKQQGPHASVMQSYIKLEEEWKQFLAQLRTNYPRYYELRYSGIFRPVDDIRASLSPQTTVVRYFFAGGKLLAFVVDKQNHHFIQLSANGLEENIRKLLQFSTDVKQSAAILHNLYRQLWAPLEGLIKHSKVVIIPDGILYQLNFEVLTPFKISKYEEMATTSLLSKYTISYQYSIWLLGNPATNVSYGKNFVAFAPGFLDEVKDAYKRTHDSLEYDHSYLSLLPQPFTISLAKRSENLLRGNAFLYAESTLKTFRDNAGQHKIIYIGTHAEADNEHPEYSKLIFAKTKSAEENFLYLPDIYNCNLQSDLTILTACETGAPGYQDGEGMISLAHAFNYAGSESIITGLWKIDEQASATITDFFYKNILQGMPKDEALRQAKLSYLAKAEGRALAPQYWSGLVLIGNSRPVSISTASYWPWIVAGLIVLLPGVYIYYRKRKKNNKDFAK